MGAGSSRAATMVWSSCGISRRAGERDAHADDPPFCAQQSRRLLVSAQARA
jgi:hypothetical protein